MANPRKYSIEGNNVVIPLDDVPTEAGAMMVEQIEVDAGVPTPITAIADDNGIRVRTGGHSEETYSADEALALGVLLVRAAMSQGAK